MFRTALALAALAIPALAPIARAGHDVETHLAPSGVAFVSEHLAESIPSALELSPITTRLYGCSGDDATATQRDTRIDLDVARAILVQPAPGMLRLELELSAELTGVLELHKPYVCSGELVCQDRASITGARAYLDLGDAVDDRGARRLAVTYADLVIPDGGLDLELSDCSLAGVANEVLGALDGVVVAVARDAVIDLAENQLGGLLSGALSSLADRDVDAGLFELSTGLTELDLTAGVRVAGEVDVRGGPAPSCFDDPGEPAPVVAPRPKLLGGTAADLGLSVNLGLINDLLYNVWKVGASCGGSSTDASFASLYLTRFPSDSRFELRAAMAAPPAITPSPAGLTAVLDAIDIELVVTEPSGREHRAGARLSATADIAMAVEPQTASLAFAVTGARVTSVVMNDERAAADLGFDAERIRQLANDHYLPRQLDDLLGERLHLPLGVSAAGFYAIARDLSAVPGYLVVKADLFAAPATDANAPDTEIVSSPPAIVRPEDAIIVARATDAEIPAELLRYRVAIDGIPFDEVGHGRIEVGVRGVTATRTVEVAAVDLAGNVDPSPAVVEVTIDGIRPEVTIDSVGSSLAFAASDDSTAAPALRARLEVIELGSGQVVYELELGAGATEAPLPSLGGGQYRAVVYVADEAGNEGVASVVIDEGGGCSAAGSTGGALLVLVALLAVGLRRRPVIAALLAASLASGCDDGAVEAELAELPDCASELGRAMWASMQPAAHNSTIPLERAAASAAWIDPRIYITGPEIWGKWAELVEGAEREINMQFYKWEPDTDPTETILAGLKALEARRRAAGASEPVIVRVVIDTSTIGAAAPVTGDHMPLIMQQAAAYAIDPRYVDITFAVDERDLLDVFGNLHVKTVVVDGQVGMITGANPEAQHNFDTPWHDIGTVFGGEIAAAVTEDFAYTWGRSQAWRCAGQTTGASCLEPVEPLGAETFAAPPSAVASGGGQRACSVLAITREPSSFSNNNVDNPQDQAYLAAFASAREVIKIETPNINDDAAKEAIIAAAVRGVPVKLITSFEFNEVAEGFVGGPNGENVDLLYRDLALAGVADPCAALEVRWYSRDGLEPIAGNGPYASHVKYASFDNQVVVVGTTNMDTASWNFSHELNLAIDDPAITASFDRQLFDADWARAIPVEQCRD